MEFVSIDVETANADIGSICQIGIAKFRNGQLFDEWSTLVDPETYFDDVNVSVHRIEPAMVIGQPTLPDVAERVRSMLTGTISVCHTQFDRIAIARAYSKYNLTPIATNWLDSARVVRRTWKDLAWSGYGLAKVCRKLGYDFQHHDALEDAKAAGFVLTAALQESQENLDHWLVRATQPIDPEGYSSGAAIRRDGNPEGDLFGEVLVFTGVLEMPRSEAANLAASVGCQVIPNVTKRTTILVVGDQDVARLAGHEKSLKHRKAEELVSTGSSIRIIRESDFHDLVRTVRNGT